MKALDSLSHYNYQPCGAGYSFVTDMGNKYIVSFLEYNIFPEARNTRLYMFNIERVESEKHSIGQDEKVRNTILCILYHFFENFTNAIVSVCDMTDGRQDARFRLFTQWTNQFLSSDIVCVKASFYVDNVKTHAALYYNVNNIDAAILVKGFSELIDVNFYN